LGPVWADNAARRKRQPHGHGKQQQLLDHCLVSFYVRARTPIASARKTAGEYGQAIAEGTA
jgi:hypothetical protein